MHSRCWEMIESANISLCFLRKMFIFGANLMLPLVEVCLTPLHDLLADMTSLPRDSPLTWPDLCPPDLTHFCPGYWLAEDWLEACAAIRGMCVLGWLDMRFFKFLNPLALRPEYSRQTCSILLLLMPWLFTSPGHQQPSYSLCRMWIM